MCLQSRLWLEWGITTLVAAMIVVGLSLSGWTARFDNLIYDATVSGSVSPVSDDILIIGIDEQSLSAIGKWPWSRDKFADGLERIATASPRAVAFDLLLSEPSDPQEDARLAQSIAAIRNIYLPVQIVAPGRNGTAFDTIPPAAIFHEAAMAVGNVNVFTDSDGIVRRLSPCFQVDAKAPVLPHLMQEMAQANSYPDCTRSDLLRFAPLPEYQYISWSSLAAGEVPPVFLTDKYILVGVTAEGLGDRHNVADGSDGTMAGITVMANYLNTILRNEFIRETGQPWHALLSLLPMIGLMLAQLRLRPRGIIILLGVGLAGLALLSVALLAARIWFAPGPALAGLLLVYPLWGWRRLQAAIDHMAGEVQRMELASTGWTAQTFASPPGDLLSEQSERLTQAIAELQNLRRFVSDSLAQLPDPMVIIDRSNLVLMTNDAAIDAFGQHMVGSDVRDCLMQLVTPGEISAVLAYVGTPSSAIRPKKDYHEFTAINGREFAMRCVQVFDHIGQQRGFILYFADVTPIAAAQREREAVLQLLSHDMRAPQSAILALLEQKPLSSDMISRIATQAHRTLSLADNFVDMARMQSVAFDPEDILLHDLLREAADGLWPLASSRGIQFCFEDESNDAFVPGERSSLFRAFTNLFDNAIKFSPVGGRVTVALSNTHKAGKAVVDVRIIDDGRGIDPEIIDTVFERFTSQSGIARSRVKGIGLGLHYVETVILRHGGTIAVKNTENRGAEFTMTMPNAD